MPLPSIQTRFKVTVTNTNGQAVPGAVVRLLNSAGVNVGTTLFINPTGATDANGIFERSLLTLSTAAPAGIYTIQVIADGYDIAELLTANTFTGRGSFAVELTPDASVTPIGGDYFLSNGMDSQYLSAMYPIYFSTESPGAFPWEVIRFLLTHLDGREGILEAPVDPVTHIADADLQSRIRLHPRPNLVPDGVTALVDPNFSDRISMTAESLTDAGTFPFGSGFVFNVANMVPTGTENALSDYISPLNGVGSKWITPFKEPVVFRGYYCDVMIWLLPIPGVYVLHTEYFNGAGAPVGAVVTETIEASEQVQRIRLNANPDMTVTYAQLRVTLDGALFSKTLTVRYRA